MEKLDNIDKSILGLIQKDCTLHKKEIASKVGLSVTATYERIKRMEKNGIIDRYVALLNKEKIGKTLVAFCTVSLQLHSKPLLKKFVEQIAKLDEIMECFHTTGTFDFLLKVVVDDMKQYQDVITNKLTVIENIALVQSSFVMTEVKQSTVYHIK
ncbi:MAG: Lrp/AsnC family transcriptional regulator [Crocinitomicaceae bacterium]|nr:Lrp/AsnC family transcriptional regulator [Crocinitomicaceae bacterium]